MKKTLLFLPITFLFISQVLSPNISLAQTTSPTPGPGEPEKISFQLDNPLGEVNSLTDLLDKFIDGILLIAIPVIVLMIIYSGFLFVKARGNSTEIEKAKKVLFSVIIGTAIILGAKLILLIVENTINSLR